MSIYLKCIYVLLSLLLIITISYETILYVTRKKTNKKIIENLTQKKSSLYIKYNVKNKNVIIVDDIIDTAGTITVASQALKEAGAKDIYVACSHPILSHPAIERINDSPIKKVITTNSIQISEDKKTDKIVQLSIAKIMGQGILNIIDGKSVSYLFTYDPNNRL